MSMAMARTEEAGSRPARVYADALLHLAALSIVAGAIHAVVAPAHFAESRIHGAFFVVLAVFQLAWAVWIYARPSSRGLWIGIAVSLAAISVWIVSRTIGVPFGPGQWQPESLGPPDLAVTASEAMIAMLAPALLASGGRAPTDDVLPLAARYLRPLVYAELMTGLLTLFLASGDHAH